MVDFIMSNGKTAYEKFVKHHPVLSLHVVNYSIESPGCIRICFGDYCPDMIYDSETCCMYRA